MPNTQLTFVVALTFTSALFLPELYAQDGTGTYKKMAEKCPSLIGLKNDINDFELTPNRNTLNEINEKMKECQTAKSYYLNINDPKLLHQTLQVIKRYENFILEQSYKITSEKVENQHSLFFNQNQEALYKGQLDLLNFENKTKNKIQKMDKEINHQIKQYNQQSVKLKEKEEELNEIEKLLDSTKKQQENQNEITKDEKIPDPTKAVVAKWGDKAFRFQFYSGFEYTDIENLFSDSTVRFGMLTYFRSGNGINDLRASVNKSGIATKPKWFKESPHFYINLATTSAAEAAAEVVEAPVGANSDTSENTNDVAQESDDQKTDSLALPESKLKDTDLQAINFEVGTFWPWYINATGSMKKNTYQEFAIGPIATWGGRKLDSLDSFQRRYYAGVRLAFNEETYFDALYGKSEPLKGKRLQLRFQLPVAETGSNSRVFLGGNANIEISKGAKDEDGKLVSEADTINVYVIWQTTFDSIF